MAISSSTRKAGPFLGNDATTVFPFAFKVFTAADLRVVNTSALGIESDLELDVDYTVALNSNQDNDPGGSVTRLAALPTGERLTITSDVEALQPLVLTNNGGFYPRVINDAFDKITIIAQQLIEQVGRSLKLPISSTASSTLPDPVANSIIAWNSSGDGFVNVAPGDLVSVAGYADARIETFVGDGVETDFALDFHPGVLANLDISLGGITQVGGVDFTFTSTTVTFTEPPPEDVAILVRYARPITPIPNYDDYITAAGEVFDFRDALGGTGGAGTVGRQGPGAGTVANDLQDYLESLAVNFGDYAPVADGTFDNAAKLTAAVAYAASVNKALYIPAKAGDYRINSAVAIPSTVTIFGDGKNRAKIVAVGCNGFEIAAAANDVVIRGLTIAAGVRHTTTTHSYSAIVVNGTNGSPCYRHRYEDLFLDGFQYGVIGNFLCSSVFDYQTVYGFSGFWLKGRSVNNTVRGSCRFNGVDSVLTAPQANSVAWRVGDATSPQPEGLIIEPGFVGFGFARGGRIQGAIFVKAIGGIYDGLGSIGIIEESSDTVPSFGNTIALNAFLFSQAADYGYFHNSTATSFRNDNAGTAHFGNTFHIYSGATLLYGVYVAGAFAEGIRVQDLQRVRGAGPSNALIDTTIRDVVIAGGDRHALQNCQFNSSTGVEISGGGLVLYEGNTGRLAIGYDRIFSMAGAARITYGTAAPSTGTGAVGDRHINTAPAAAGVPGWVCTTAGSPGTWKAEAALAA